MPTVPLPLVAEQGGRIDTLTKDVQLKNLYIDKTGNKDFWVVKRPGSSQDIQPAAGAGTARGCFNWDGTKYSVIDNTLYKGTTSLSVSETLDNAAAVDAGGGDTTFPITGHSLLAGDRVTITGTTNYDGTYYIKSVATNTITITVTFAAETFAGTETVVSHLTGSSSRVYWALIDTDPRVLCVQCDGDLYTISDADVVTRVTDTDYPSNVIGGIVYMNGYIFVSTTKGQIYNSNAGDETAWTATDFLTAEAQSDDGVSIIRYKDNIVAFGEYSTQFFYDAANASGSPLSKVEGSVTSIGCCSATTVVNVDPTVFWVGQDSGGGRFICSLEGYVVQKVSNPYINRLLNAEGAGITSCNAYAMRVDGHQFYIVNLNSQGISIVYDVDMKLWFKWTLYTGGAETYFKFIDHITDDDEGNFLLHETDGYFYSFDIDTYQDAGQTIYVSGQTALFDGDTQENKFMERLEVVGDHETTAATLTISYSDDNYKNFSTGRAVDLVGRPYLTRLGRFVRRAFKYTFESNDPMRLKSFMVTVNKGFFGQ